MLDDYLNSLNPKQREAAELGCENALVLAGAGSGKPKYSRRALLCCCRERWLVLRKSLP